MSALAIARPVKRINVEDAKLKTATVEIKSLTLNARQLTLSVFRQIQEEQIIDDETFQFKGIPWGIVNYFWKGCEGDIHVLWQSGNELRRSINSEYFSKILEKITSDPMSLFSSIRYDNGTAYKILDFYHESLRKWGYIPIDKAYPLNEMMAYLENIYDNYDDYRNKYNDLLDELGQLDQLFIAV